MSSTSAQFAPSTPALPQRSWWREPYVWLVISGPAVVVVAALATAYIAMSAPDPVIDKNQIQREALTKAGSDGRVSEDELVKLQPAQQARNHAASPVVPKVKPDN